MFDAVRSRVRARPRATTAVLSLVGYALVVAVFGGLVSFPQLTDAQVRLFAHLIAGINTLALLSLLAGTRAVRRGNVRRHRALMLTAFALILLFLVVYLWKVGGGYERRLVAPAVPKAVYLGALAVHLLLSVVSVPVVLHAVVLGLTHSPAELRDTVHPRVGRVAVAAWTVSLALGLLVYVFLNHLYEAEPIVEGAASLVVLL